MKPKTGRPFTGAIPLAVLAAAAALSTAPRAGVPPSVVESKDSLPFTISRDSVLEGVPMKIGDLVVVTEAEANAIAKHAADGRHRWGRCVEAGPTWVRWSDDGTRLELISPWDLSRGSRVATAYCAEGIVMIGGATPSPESDEGETEAILFVGGGAAGERRTLAFGKHERADNGTIYRLTETRAIDPVSRRILFAATSEDGEEALLAAPFAILARR